MIEKVVMPTLTAVLTLAVVVVFHSVLNEPQDVVPLFLVPIFLYIGYITVKASPKVWIGVTVAITLALAILYALLLPTVKVVVQGNHWRLRWQFAQSVKQK